MSGTLFVVATPIGNLEDVTLRALRVLREVDLIAAEDTRRTAKLLSHHGIATPTMSFHAHNTRGRVPQLIAQLKSGRSVALVSDAGTPGLSDPGEELIRACIEENIPVDPIPGASAPLAAVVASGFPVLPLTVLGFVPNKMADRTAWLAMIAGIRHTVTFFESPLRLKRTLLEASPLLVERPIVVARELTKVHQELLRGTCEQIAASLDGVKGEITVVVGPVAEASAAKGAIDEEVIAGEFWALAKSRTVSRRAAIASLAEKFQLSSREIYSIVERTKRSGE
ncbi:MAG TPA: 16S rRNA (cytidine(1402)-2'-O)-methyltransferase [Vicinamibacterales bacterium]